jgi:hypothetical protein
MAELPLPMEYGLLGGRPEPWEPWQSVAVMRQRGFLMGSIWFKLWRAAALRAVGPEAIRWLRYDDGGQERYVAPQADADEGRWVAGLRELAPAIEALLALAPADATIAGSNNWALSGARTASGLPLLAGDPHRIYEIPGMYAQLHLSCDDFDALGFSVPGVPAFPHFCHTASVAWCVTHAFADIHDLYLERTAIEGEMEIEVGLHGLRIVSFLLGADEGGVDALEFGDEVGVDVGQCLDGGQGFEQQAQAADLHVLGQRQAAGQEVVAGLHFDGAIVGQQQDGLAHRRLAHVQVGGEFAYLQALAGLEAARHQAVAQRAVDLGRQAGTDDGGFLGSHVVLAREVGPYFREGRERAGYSAWTGPIGRTPHIRAV